VRRVIRRLLVGGHDRGASAVEYGLLIAAIAAVIVGVVFGVSGLITDAMHDTCTVMEQDPADGSADTTPDSATC
jgi:pilus assembly protein Flp/PilA